MASCKRCGSELRGKQISYCTQRCSKLHLKKLYKKRNRDKINDYNRRRRAAKPSSFRRTIGSKNTRLVVDILAPDQLEKLFTVIPCVVCPGGKFFSLRKRNKCPLHNVRMTKKLRYQILKRDSFTCVYCGRRPPEVSLVVDHQKSWKDGGMTIGFNLATACTECNGGKGRDSITLSAISG